MVQVSERAGYFRCPARIGFVRTGEGEVCLIDSGNDRDAGKKVKRILDQQGWQLRAIYNTHAHADHVGGNRYLQAQTGCRAFATDVERAFACHPILEPSFLYGGNPPADLRHKFLMAQDSEVEPLTPEALPEGWTLLPLPGHSFDMVGFRTEEGIVFLADCLSSEATLEKYQISFLVDVGAYLETLERVKQMEARCIIPSHAEPTADISPLAQKNIDKVHEIADAIVAICAEPVGFEAILEALFNRYQLAMSFEQHALVGSTVRSYLAWLKSTGRLEADIDHNRLLWRA